MLRLGYRFGYGLCLLFWLGLGLPTLAAADWLHLPGARYERIEEPVFGGRAWVYEAGAADAPPVVLVHGLGDHATATWRHLIPVLARDYRVLTFDLPGFGRSDKANVLYSPSHYADFIAFVAERYLDAPFTLIGHSLGGAIALRYAAEHPAHVQRLVLVNVAGVLHRSVYTEFLSRTRVDTLPEIFPGQGEQLVDLTGRLLRVVERLDLDHDAMLDSERFRDRVLGGSPTQIAAYALLEENYGPLIPRVRAPTVVIWGEQDTVAPLRTGRLIAGNIPGATLQVLPGLAHLPMHEDRESFNQAVLDALQRAVPTDGYARPAQAPANDRVGRCVGQEEARFSGDYRAIEIRRCRHVHLDAVTTGRLIVEGSTVVLDNSHIRGRRVGLTASGSEIQMTAGSISGEVAIEVRGSRLDLAGVRVHGEDVAARAYGRQSSEIIYSSSWVRKGNEPERAWHGVWTLRP